MKIYRGKMYNNYKMFAALGYAALLNATISWVDIAFKLRHLNSLMLLPTGTPSCCQVCDQRAEYCTGECVTRFLVMMRMHRYRICVG